MPQVQVLSPRPPFLWRLAVPEDFSLFFDYYGPNFESQTSNRHGFFQSFTAHRMASPHHAVGQPFSIHIGVYYSAADLQPSVELLQIVLRQLVQRNFSFGTMSREPIRNDGNPFSCISS